MQKIQQLQNWIDSSSYTVFFGGAGVATESGIPDFRSADGIYQKNRPLRPEQILSHDFFVNYPEEFYKFYRSNLLFPNAKPNAAHITLARLEQVGKLQAVITQNIDNLHQAAGSKRVLELHGSVYRNYCTHCKRFYDFDYVYKSLQVVPRCTCGGIIKPDVVLYQEALNEQCVDQAIKEIQRAQLLIISGTSLSVYPAAGLIDFFKGEHLVLINKDATPADSRADLLIRDKVGEVFSKIKV